MVKKQGGYEKTNFYQPYATKLAEKEGSMGKTVVANNKKKRAEGGCEREREKYLVFLLKKGV